jgi:hypothetical protein
MIKLAFLFAVLSIGFVNNAWADGRDLLKECTKAVAGHRSDEVRQNQSKSDSLEVGLCLGMMEGVTNLNAMYQYKLGKGAIFCLPVGGLKNGKAAELVVKYLNDHPAELDEHAIVLIYRALNEAFPCN